MTWERGVDIHNIGDVSIGGGLTAWPLSANIWKICFENKER